MTQPFPKEMFLEGYLAPIGIECDAADLIVEGELPKDLAGVYLRNGPDPLHPAREGETYHWFHGDGMVHRFEFSDGRVSWRNRWVRTRKYELERAAGKSLFGVLGNPFTMDPSVAGEPYNTANTHIVLHANRLLAHMEGTNAVEMKIDTLETIGDFNYQDAITGPITAHPKIDPISGELLFFGSQAAGPGSADIGHYVADNTGKLTRQEMFEGPFPSMIHDFCVTENYSIYPVFPLVFSMDRAMAGEVPMVWEPDRGTHFGVIPRHGKASDVRWFNLDARFGFHMVNAHEEGDQLIMEVTAANATQFSAMKNGELASESEGLNPSLRRWTIDLAGSSSGVKENILDDMTTEFPRIDERMATRAYRHVFAAGNGDDVAFTFCDLVYYDLQTGKRKVYPGNGRYLFGEPVFAPRDNSSEEGDGYVIVLAYNQDSGLSELMLFEALEIDRGPVAKVMMPLRIPAGFHGSWVTSAQMAAI